MNKLRAHLDRSYFTPEEVWAIVFLSIATPAIMFLVALVEMGMGWGWGFSLMALTIVLGVCIADLKEEAQERRLDDYRAGKERFEEEHIKSIRHPDELD